MISSCSKGLLLFLAAAACLHQISNAQSVISDRGAIGDDGTTPCPAGLALVPTAPSAGAGFDSQASYTYRSEFCCQGSAFIIGWIMADISFSSSSSRFPRYLGSLTAACSDEPDLPLVVDGSSFASNCPVPSSISSPYTNVSFTGFRSFNARGGLPTTSSTSAVVTSFSALQQSSSQASFSCPTGQRAVGFSVTSTCFGLTNLQVICGNATGSGSIVASPPSSARTPLPDPSSTSASTSIATTPASTETSTSVSASSTATASASAVQSHASSPSASTSSAVSYYPVFSPLATGGVTLAGTFRSSPTSQGVTLNGTFDAPINASKSVLVPTVTRSGCSSLSIKGSPAAFTAFASTAVQIQTQNGTSFVDSTTGQPLGGVGYAGIQASQVDSTKPSVNFLATADVITVALNNPGTSNGFVSAAVTYQPKSACTAGSSGNRSTVGIQKNGQFGPGGALMPLIFTNATCMRLSVLVIPDSNQTARQTSVTVQLIEGPGPSGFGAGTGFLTRSPAAINLTIDGSTANLSQNAVQFNNSLDPSRLYRLQTLNGGQSSSMTTTVSIVAAVLDGPGADCSQIGANFSLPAGTVSQASSGVAPAAGQQQAQPGPRSAPPSPPSASSQAPQSASTTSSSASSQPGPQSAPASSSGAASSAPAPNTGILCRIAQIC